MWELNNKGIYILKSNEDRPIKIQYKDNSISHQTEKYKLTLKEVLKNELKYNWSLRENLTRQQIHTEYGKLKKDRCKEVVNFLVKRGITREYIENEVNQEREKVIFTKKINIPSNLLSANFGIVNLE